MSVSHHKGGLLARDGDATSRAHLAIFATIVSLAVSGALLWARPDLTRGAAFLFSDQAANLFVADALHQGASLFTGVAFPYGPVSIELYVGVARWLGNTPLVYLVLMAALAAISAGMVVWLVGRSADTLTTLATVAIGVLATMPLPGANIGGYTSSIYMPLERLCLLGAALLWSSPRTRSVRTSLMMGVVLGFCQGIRFGSGAMAVAAVIVVDQAASLRRESWWPDQVVVRSSALVIAGFLMSEAAWAAWAFAMFPRPYALEFLWPLQMWQTHQASGAPRWPTWAGWKMAATTYVLPATALCVGLAGFVRWTTRPAGARTTSCNAAGGAFVLFVFFVLGSLAYFRHEHHFRQFAWMLVPGAAVTLAWSGTRIRFFALALCAPAIWPLVSSLVHHPPADVVPVTVPRGFTLYVSPAVVSQLAFLDTVAASGPVLFVPNGAGWLYAYDVPHVTRHTWFYSSAVVRPFEYASFTAEASAAVVVIRCPIDGGAMPLPPPAIERIEERFAEAKAGSGCRTWTPRAGPR